MISSRPLIGPHSLPLPAPPDGAFSHTIDYATIFLEILNHKGHPNGITGLRVTVILLNSWILPIGGASAVEGLRSTGVPRLAFFTMIVFFLLFSNCNNAFTFNFVELYLFVMLRRMVLFYVLV